MTESEVSVTRPSDDEVAHPLGLSRVAGQEAHQGFFVPFVTSVVAQLTDAFCAKTHVVTHVI